MNDPIDTAIGTRIREARFLTPSPTDPDKPMTLAQLGDAVGVSFQQIQKYENGSNKISSSRLWAIAEALNQPINFFFAEIGEQPLPAISEQALKTARLLDAIPDGKIKTDVSAFIREYSEMPSKLAG